jgi:hypothetical protein
MDADGLKLANADADADGDGDADSNDDRVEDLYCNAVFNILTNGNFYANYFAHADTDTDANADGIADCNQHSKHELFAHANCDAVVVSDENRELHAFKVDVIFQYDYNDIDGSANGLKILIGFGRRYFVKDWKSCALRFSNNESSNPIHIADRHSASYAVKNKNVDVLAGGYFCCSHTRCLNDSDINAQCVPFFTFSIYYQGFGQQK